MLKRAITLASLIVLPTGVLAQSATSISADTQTLLDALRLDEMIGIMHREGLDYGTELGEEMLPGRDLSEWNREVGRVYDLDKMVSGLTTVFAQEIDGTDLKPLTDFFTSDLGTQIVSLEYTAREAFLDETIEEAAIARVFELEEAKDARLAQVKEFIASNDYIETNVVGALNANYAFYLGLLDGDGIEMGLTEDQILSTVWEQELEIRDNTTEWLNSYLLMAYQPLSDDELAAYQAILATEEGRALNRALFAGFDQMYVAISRELGLSVSRFSGGEEL